MIRNFQISYDNFLGEKEFLSEKYNKTSIAESSVVITPCRKGRKKVLKYGYHKNNKDYSYL